MDNIYLWRKRVDVAVAESELPNILCFPITDYVLSLCQCRRTDASHQICDGAMGISGGFVAWIGTAFRARNERTLSSASRKHEMPLVFQKK